MLLVIDANEETIAAISAAKVNPSKPLGSNDIIIGYALSLVSNKGNNTAAHMPGRTITSGIIIFR
jgi:hypothetical protein